MEKSLKDALIEEIKAAMSVYDCENDIVANDIMDATGVSYNRALNFLDMLAREGILQKVKLPSRSVVYRDIDGMAIERIKTFVSSIKQENDFKQH